MEALAKYVSQRAFRRNRLEYLSKDATKQGPYQDKEEEEPYVFLQNGHTGIILQEKLFKFKGVHECSGYLRF